MAAQGVLTLNTKAYNPRGTQGGISTWQNTGDASFGGATTSVTESVRGPGADGNYRVRFLLTIPKLATADTSCGCIGQTLGKPAKADVTIDVPTVFTAAERDDLRLRIQALVAHAVLTVAVRDLEGSWS
jgi:hypothetical protein